MLGIVSFQPANDQELFQPGAKPEKLADGFKFTEGPCADAKGNVYFTDQPNDRIMIWSISDKLSVFMQPSGRSNGMSFDRSGNLWSCADEKNELWCIARDKKTEVVLSGYNNKLLNGPNDLWIAPDNGMYLTDPYYQRPWWKHSAMPQEVQAVYYLTPDHKKLVRVVDDLVQPNGIVGTPDGKILYVADIADNKTWSYSINMDGSLSHKTLFCELGSDGMTIDVEGNLYLTGNGVIIFNKEGKQIGKIEVPEKWTANVCFGGADMKSLFITASTRLYRMRMKVRGTAKTAISVYSSSQDGDSLTIKAELRKEISPFDLSSVIRKPGEIGVEIELLTDLLSLFCRD
jgi:gluconolactonase